MSWFTDLADKAENLLNNLDEKTGVALRNHNILKSQHVKHESEHNEIPPRKQKTSRRSIPKSVLPSLPKVNHMSEVPKSSPQKSNSASHSANKTLRRVIDDKPVKQKIKSHCEKSCDLNHSVRTLAEDFKLNDISASEISFKTRRLSLPDKLEFLDKKSILDKCRNMEIENTILKSELNLMNNEVAQLLYKLRTTTKEANEVTKLKDENLLLEQNLMELKQENKDILTRINTLEMTIDEKQKENLRYEKDMKYAQNINNELQLELTKTKEECQRLQKDWDAYKLRVKNMLIAKDREIKTLHVEPVHSEETKTFTAELETLRLDREKLIEDLNHIRNEYDDMKLCMEDLESKSHSTEKIVTALRDALREERVAKNRLEVDFTTLNKEYKKLQVESSQVIDNLREELAQKERVTNVKYSPSDSDRSSDINTLNVADYEAIQDNLASEKIQRLTDTLVAKQTKIDSLIAENNMMRIQMEKLESKYKNDIAAQKMNHSVVHVNDNDVIIRERTKTRKYIPESIFSRISVTIGAFLRRHPLFRMFVIVYMVGLHLWVLLILLTYSPDGQNYKQYINARH